MHLSLSIFSISLPLSVTLLIVLIFINRFNKEMLFLFPVARFQCLKKKLYASVMFAFVCAECSVRVGA